MYQVLEEVIVGRAIGLFLLVVGIGLAVYGLPTAEPDRMGRSLVGGDRSAGETDIERAPEASADDRSRAVEERSRANGAPTRGRNVAGSMASETSAGQSVEAAQAIAPMEKLRAAANVRLQAALDEPVGSLRPLSSGTVAETAPLIPRPVEVPIGMRPAVSAPAVVATARRETSARSGQGATTAHGVAGLSTGKSGWTTSIASNAAGATSTGPALTQTATITIPSGPRSETSLVKKPANVEMNPRSAADELPAKLPLAGDRSDPAENPPAKPLTRTQVAQRYAPPVYLGRPPSPTFTYTYVPSSSGFPSAIGNSGPKRKFRTQDMWDRQRRDGM